MSQINVDNIKNRLGSGAPSFPNGIDVSSGVTTFTNGLNVGTGASVFSPGTNELALGTNSAERVRVDSSGNIGIGTDNPNYPFHVFNSGQNNVALFESGDPNATFGLSDSNGSVNFRTTNGKLLITTGGDAGTTGTNGNESLVIKSTGEVGIGTDNPQEKLHVQGDVRLVDNSPRIGFHDANASTNIQCTGGIEIFDQNGNRGAYMGATEGSNFLSFGISPSAGANPTEKLRITSGGNIEIANGNLVFSTSGTGIDFSATSDGSGTTTSELLDEYEEGTWTPVFKGAGTAGSYTLSVTEAQYTRIGRMVHLYCQFSISSIGSAGSAYAVIEGMPFDVGSQTLGSCSLSGVDIATAGTHYHVTRVSGVSDHRLYFFVSQDNASPYDIQVSEFSSGDSVMVTMMYTAA